MKRIDLTTASVLMGVLLAARGASVLASGFQLQEQTASGLGLAYSGMPAAAQDAGVAFWNPAALPLLQGTQFAVATHVIDSSFDFRSSGPPPAGSTYDALGDGGDAGSKAFVPAVYAKLDITPRLAAGLALNAPFGLKTDWSTPWAGMFAAARSEVKTLNINPSLGYRLGTHFLLGAGVSYERLKATLSNGVSATAIAQVEGSDWAYGWNVGALYDSDHGTRVGVTYRSAIDYSIEGQLTFNTPALAARASSVKADLKLPQTVAVGVSQQLGENLRMLADVTWTGWDSIQTLAIIATSGAASGQPVASTPLNFRNTWRVGTGLEYQLNPQWLLRGGLAYDRSPVQDTFRTPRLPDDDRKWLGVGARFQPSDRWSIDAGYVHLWIQEAPSSLSPVGAAPGVLRGRYVSSSNIYAVQASMRF